MSSKNNKRSFGRAELVNLISTKHNLDKEKSTNLLDLILDTFMESLNQHSEIKIPQFGTFIVKEKKARPGRNPKTKEEVEIKPRRVVALKISKILKDKIKKLT